jgi:hypothetical protein
VAVDYGSVYGSLGSYFGTSGGTGSPGKSGAAGYSNDQTTGGTRQTGDAESQSAQSGSGWISAAATSSETDKSNFSTPFTQGFGGITNNQIIQSPGATNNAATQPITAPPVSTQIGGSLLGGLDPTTLLVLALVFVLVMRR